MGNRACTQLGGIDMIHLVGFLIGTPAATIEEMAIHVYNSGGELHSKSTILKQQLKEIEITKKKASVEAYQSMREDVQFCLKCFCDCPLLLEYLGKTH